MRIALVVALLVGAACSKDKSGPVPSSPLAADTVEQTRTLDASSAVAPTAPPLGGERVVDTESGELDEVLPAIPQGSVDPADPSPAYKKATDALAAGKSSLALAYLHALLTTKGCAKCDPYVLKVAEDPVWRPLATSLLFIRVVDAWSPAADYGPADWDGEACPPGTVRKGKWKDPDDLDVWCEKPGGVKHGPKYVYQHPVDMGEGSHTEREHYRNGKQHGASSDYTSFSDYSSSFYIDGKPAGVASSGHENGEDVTRSLKLGSNVEIVWVFDERAETHKLMVSDTKAGTTRTWLFSKGWRVLSEVAASRNKKLHGQQISYHPSTGHPRKLATYDAGVLHGPFKYWDPSGKQLAASVFDHGTGEYTEFDSEMALVEQGKLVKGVKDGKWIDQSSERYSFERSEGTYRAGVKDGPWVEGQDRGSYVKGKRDGPWVIELRSSKANQARGSYKRGVMHGMWTYLGDGGAVIASGEIANDKPVGVWKLQDESQVEFSRSGKLVKIDGEAVRAADYELDPLDFISDPQVPAER